MFQFTDDCRTGIEQIDEEHRTLFELLNESYTLVTTVYGGDYFDQLKDMIGRLDDYAELHFNHEEEYMAQIRDPELILQRAQHDFFRHRICGFSVVNIDEEEEQRRVLADLVDFLAKWLYRHILSSDILIGKLPPLEEWMIKENPCEFTDDYRIGIDLIDHEHEQLFHIVDQAYRMAKTFEGSVNGGEAARILEQLSAYTKEHFRDEEEYMESIQYEGLAAQKRAHEAFVDKLETIDIKELENGSRESFQQLVEFLLGWLINHILQSDKKIPMFEQDE